LPELRAARHRLRRLPVPGFSPHGQRRGDRSSLSSLPRPSPDRDGTPRGGRREARTIPLSKPTRPRRGATVVLTRTTRPTYCPNLRSTHGAGALVELYAPIDTHTRMGA